MPRMSFASSITMLLTAVFLVAVMVGTLHNHSNRNNAPPPQPEPKGIHTSWEPMPPSATAEDVKRVAANRDYPWYAALNGVEDMREDNRLAQLFSSNPDLKLRAAEDEIKRQMARQAVNQTEKRLAEAETLSRLVNDPLPRWAAKAIYDKAEANWILRTEYVVSRDHKTSPERIALETECLALIAKVHTHWDTNYAGVHVVPNTPVTALP